MGIVVNKKQNDRSAIQARINADLRARLQASSDEADTDIEQSEYLACTTKTSRFGWVWLLLIVGAIISIILIITV